MTANTMPGSTGFLGLLNRTAQQSVPCVVCRCLQLLRKALQGWCPALVCMTYLLSKTWIITCVKIRRVVRQGRACKPGPRAGNSFVNINCVTGNIHAQQGCCVLGRAGRDGQPARCLLLYRFSDALRQAAIVNFEPTWQANLFAMMQYAAALSTCRRAALSR